MAETETLLEVDWHTDDETGMYSIGEIDFGIGDVKGYLEKYGQSGSKKIETLAEAREAAVNFADYVAMDDT